MDPNTRSRIADSILGITSGLEGLKMQANGDDNKEIVYGNKNEGHLTASGKFRRFEISKNFAGLTTFPKT
jgi:hypothetical protein